MEEELVHIRCEEEKGVHREERLPVVHGHVVNEEVVQHLRKGERSRRERPSIFSPTKIFMFMISAMVADALSLIFTQMESKHEYKYERE